MDKVNSKIKNSPKNDDVLVYKNNSLQYENKLTFLDDIIGELKIMKKELKELKETSEKFKKDVNDMLEKYHKVLQTLVKEGN